MVQYFINKSDVLCWLTLEQWLTRSTGLLKMDQIEMGIRCKTTKKHLYLSRSVFVYMFVFTLPE